MKKYLLASLLLVSLPAASSAFAQEKTVTLDLTKADTSLAFDSDTGAWTGTYDDDQFTIDSQLFCFLHNSMSDWNTWWGFTASKSTDNSFRDNFVKYQFSNMPKGGIVLGSDGNVSLDKFGAPVVSPDVPYLVAFANNMFAAHPAELVLSDGEDHEVVGMYVSLNSYSYYAIADGDSFARAFTNGDSFTLTVHGVNSREEETSLDVKLASYANGDLTTTRGWKYVDLSPLGKVNQLWFSLKSTDSSAYGDNTPCYFCLDKLTVKTPDISSGIEKTVREKIGYDRSSDMVRLSGADFAIVYDVAGNAVKSADSQEFSLSGLPHGVYVVKAGNASLKIAKH